MWVETGVWFLESPSMILIKQKKKKKFERVLNFQEIYLFRKIILEMVVILIHCFSFLIKKFIKKIGAVKKGQIVRVKRTKSVSIILEQISLQTSK